MLHHIEISIQVLLKKIIFTIKLKISTLPYLNDVNRRESKVSSLSDQKLAKSLQRNPKFFKI